MRDDSVLLARRPSEGLLGGMWEFPNGRVTGDPLEGLADALKTGYNLRLKKSRSKIQQEPLTVVHHGYTHFSVDTYVYRCELASSPDTEYLRWVPLKELDDFPMGKIDRQIASLLQE